MTAFRILSESLTEKQLNGVKMRDIEMWAKSKVMKLNEESSKVFNQIDRENRGVKIYQILVYRISRVQIIRSKQPL